MQLYVIGGENMEDIRIMNYVEKFAAIIPDAPAIINIEKQFITYSQLNQTVFVMSQFVLSITLVVSSMIIFRQANFMKAFSTGYSKEDIVEFSFRSGQDNVLNEVSDYLNANPNVEGFSFAGRRGKEYSQYPGILAGG